MARHRTGTNIEPSPYFGALQEVVNDLFRDLKSDDPQLLPTVRRLDVVLAGEAADLPEDLVEIIRLLPPGTYTRTRLCDQINSAINGHAWGQVYGTVS